MSYNHSLLIGAIVQTSHCFCDDFIISLFLLVISPRPHHPQDKFLSKFPATSVPYHLLLWPKWNVSRRPTRRDWNRPWNALCNQTYTSTELELLPSLRYPVVIDNTAAKSRANYLSPVSAILHRTGSRPVGVVTFQRGLDETRRGSCSQEEVSAPTSRKKKLKKQNKKNSVVQAWSHAMPGRACTPVCRQGWTCTARCLLLPLKGEVQPWIIRRFHFKTNVIFSKHDCVFFRPSLCRLCLVCLFYGLTGDWCSQPTWLLWYRPAFRNDTCLFFHIAV